MRSCRCHQTRSAVDSSGFTPFRIHPPSANCKLPPRRPLPAKPVQLCRRELPRCLAESDAPDSSALVPSMPAGEPEEHEQGQALERFLQLTELMLLVAAAAPHVVAALAHMRHVTQHTRTVAQRPSQVAVYPCQLCFCSLCNTPAHHMPACMPDWHA